MGGKAGYARFLAMFQRRKKPENISVFCVQEHMLSEDLHDEWTNKAKIAGFTLIISYGKADDETSKKGGVLILIDDSALDFAHTLHSQPGFLHVDLRWGGRDLRVACVYAPAHSGNERLDFFNDIKTKLTSTTLVGGDWNCVPDKTVDVDSKNPLGYPNVGSQLMNTMMTDLGLVDERREQLGTEAEYTRKGNTANGVTSTRIDIWFTPSNLDLLQTYHVDNSFIFKLNKSDHNAVSLELDNQRGELGKDRKTIDEELIMRPDIQAKIKEIKEQEYRGNALQRKKWKRTMDKICQLLMKETAAKRKKDKAEIKRLQGILQIINVKHKKRGATPTSVAAEKRIVREIYELKHPETIREASTHEASRMYEKSEVCTKAMFSTFKSRAKQQWINEISIADKWEEGREPTYTGKTKNTAAVGTEFVRLYQMIFAEKHITNESWLLDKLGENKLLKLSRERLDKPFSKGEVATIMEGLASHKQAGPSRIPSGLFKMMSTTFAEPFADLINECQRTGKLPEHFLEGDISMLYKKGDRCEPRNYRPITLLNSDYRVFTKVLAARMGTVVHEFVSECQKGFVPDTFIAEATTLMRGIEAYINDKPEDRQGIMLFLDMEKAFDRVSYDFTLRGLKAIGFGKNFRKWVGMMYNVKRPPRRRMYVNGYYSEWFDIKSGVAQGCPLSPLLFLVVAQALKIALFSEKKLKGITINDEIYKVIQFADDTTIFMTDIKEMRAATTAINKWCAATGMRENVKKREGLAMGRYRTQDLDHGVKWAPEGRWCTALGVPLGNDLNEDKWWSEKITAVRRIASQWLTLRRSRYFGRNLIVQGMYFGRLRYWLYSLHMSKRTIQIVQKDADILWWSRDPILEDLTDDQGNATRNQKRVRRWVNKDTVIGPLKKGGLNNMDWATHVEAVRQQWVIRYLDPSESSWKRLWDRFILYDKKGNLKYPEGREVLLYNLSGWQKLTILANVPRKATYIRACLKEFWKLKLHPKADSYEGVSSESPWYGHRLRLDVENNFRNYCRNVLQITKFSDFMNVKTNRPFTTDEWIDVIEKHEKEAGIRSYYRDVWDTARKVHRLQQQLRTDREIPKELMRRYTAIPTVGMWVYLMRGENLRWPAIITDTTSQKARRVRIDGVGRSHPLNEEVNYRHFTVIEAHKWQGKWGKPKGESFVQDVKWDFHGEEYIQNLTINRLTKLRQEAKMKPPPSQDVWNSKLGSVHWDKVWGAKSMYATPRDKTAQFQLKQRNLWVAKSGGCADTSCKAHGCSHEESQEHLWECQQIQRGFWEPLWGSIERMGLNPKKEATYAILGITGARKDKSINREEAGIIQMAWRTLYAQTVKTKLEGGHLNLPEAVYKTLRLTLSRVKAYGNKWQTWYRRQAGRTKPKTFPEEHQQHALITLDDSANYVISDELLKEVQQARSALSTKQREN